MPVELLIAPLRLLLTALGTGVLPPGSVSHTLAASAGTLSVATADAGRTVAAATPDWQGTGGVAAREAATVADRAALDAADDGMAVAAIVETAAGRVREAARQLDALLQSFAATATALGPALATPAGLSALLPVAVDALSRGAAIVAATQAELRGDAAHLQDAGRTPAPAEVQPVDAVTGDADPAEGGVAVTLPDGSVAYAPNERAATAVRAALGQQGVPYVWGGTSPAGFDCSGLTQWAYRQAGVELPRLAQDQDTAGIPVAQSDLRPGDLAVWSGHVAMYVGNGQMVEAGDPVQVSPVRTTNLDHTFEGFYRPR